ncbi:hypothetical protein FRB90_003859 [Tulasnella sp. 427]|nr:hypothetical protein FRB90_003859 [Tulasnella sp. 427]
MANNYDDEVIADSEEDCLTPPPPESRLATPKLSRKGDPLQQELFQHHRDRVGLSATQRQLNVSSISEFTAPPPPPQPPTTSLISAIITSSVARPIISDVAETITSIFSPCPDKPKKRPRPRPRVRQPDSVEPEPEQTNALPAAKVVDTVPTPSVPTPSSERKSKALPLQEVIVVVPPPPKQRPSTSAVPREIVTISSSDVEEIPVQKPTKKRKLSTPAAGPSSSRHAGAPRKSKTLLLSDEDEDDPIQLKGSEPPKSPRLSIQAPHVSSLPTAKNPPATAKPLYDDDRFSDFDPSESTKAPKKPKTKAKTKKAQAEVEGELGGQAAKPKKPRKSKAKSKHADENEGDGPTETLDDGFKSKEFIMDSDEESGGSRPNPNPIADSPTGKRKAQDDIAPPPKRISLGGSDDCVRYGHERD